MRAALLLTVVPAAALAQATAPATKGAAPAVGRDDKVICRSMTETGSLIAARKECKTRREWDQQAATSQKQLSDCVTGAGATGARC